MVNALRKIFICFFLTCFISLTFADVPETSTNWQILNKLCYELYVDVFSAISINDSTAYIIQIMNSNDDVKKILEIQLARYQKDKSISNFFIGQPSGFSSYNIIQIVPEAIPVKYSKVKNDNKDSIKRTIDIKAYAKVTDQQSRLFYAQTFEKNYHDFLNNDNFKDIEDEQYPVTIGQGNKNIFLKSFEPVFISVITASIIYFFYSFRSK